jgi:hypothetical protein
VRFSLDFNLAARGHFPELLYRLGDGRCSPSAPKVYAHLVEVGVEHLAQRNQRVFRVPVPRMQSRFLPLKVVPSIHFLPLKVVPPIQFTQLRYVLHAQLPRFLF